MFDARECVICNKLFIPKTNKQNTCSVDCRRARKNERNHISALEYRSLKVEEKKKGREAISPKPSNLAVSNEKAREKGYASYGLYKAALFLESQKLAKSDLLRKE